MMRKIAFLLAHLVFAVHSRRKQSPLEVPSSALVGALLEAKSQRSSDANTTTNPRKTLASLLLPLALSKEVAFVPPISAPLRGSIRMNLAASMAPRRQLVGVGFLDHDHEVADLVPGDFGYGATPASVRERHEWLPTWPFDDIATLSSTAAGQKTNTFADLLPGDFGFEASVPQTRRLTLEKEMELGRSIQTLMWMRQARTGLEERLGRESTVQEWAKACGITSLRAFNYQVRLGERARSQMISANLGLVYTIAFKMRASTPTELSQEDLVQEGVFGLIKAAEKYNPSRKLRFSTYAYSWIKSTMQLGAYQDGIVRIPMGRKRELNKFAKAKRELIAKLGNEPSIAELAMQMKVKESKVKYLHSLLKRRYVSLDQRSRITDKSHYETTPSNQPQPDELLEYQELEEKLYEVLNKIDPVERAVLTMRMGLVDEKITFAEIDRRLDLSSGAANRIYASALKKLQRSLGGEANWTRI